MFKKRYIVNGELVVDGKSVKWFNLDTTANPADVWDTAKSVVADMYQADSRNVRITGVFKL